MARGLETGTPIVVHGPVRSRLTAAARPLPSDESALPRCGSGRPAARRGTVDLSAARGSPEPGTWRVLFPDIAASSPSIPMEIPGVLRRTNPPELMDFGRPAEAGIPSSRNSCKDDRIICKSTTSNLGMGSLTIRRTDDRGDRDPADRPGPGLTVHTRIAEQSHNDREGGDGVDRGNDINAIPARWMTQIDKTKPRSSWWEG
jgi:hypothetical protein